MSTAVRILQCCTLKEKKKTNLFTLYTFQSTEFYNPLYHPFLKKGLMFCFGENESEMSPQD